MNTLYIQRLSIYFSYLSKKVTLVWASRSTRRFKQESCLSNPELNQSLLFLLVKILKTSAYTVRLRFEPVTSSSSFAMSNHKTMVCQSSARWILFSGPMNRHIPNHPWNSFWYGPRTKQSGHPCSVLIRTSGQLIVQLTPDWSDYCKIYAVPDDT